MEVWASPQSLTHLLVVTLAPRCPSIQLRLEGLSSSPVQTHPKQPMLQPSQPDSPRLPQRLGQLLLQRSSWAWLHRQGCHCLLLPQPHPLSQVGSWG